MDEKELEYYPNARWAIGRITASGEFIGLVQDSPVTNEREVFDVLVTLGLDSSDSAIVDLYFPRNKDRQRCPTFALMRLWYQLSPIRLSDANGRV